MLLHLFLLTRIAFIHNGQLDYHGLFNVVVVLVLLGLGLVWLWQIARELTRSSQPMRRVVGRLLLLVTVVLAMNMVGFIYWESQLVWELLD